MYFYNINCDFLNLLNEKFMIIIFIEIILIFIFFKIKILKYLLQKTVKT